jgi:8-oxo-dGTP diphosphatase
MHKTIKFSSDLVPLVLSGEKVSTWRLWDDKDLSVGDICDMIDKGTGKRFAVGKLTRVFGKPLGELNDEDKEGHEKFISDKKMYETYSQYYGRPVDKTTSVKIIAFTLIPPIDRVGFIEIKDKKILLALSKNSNAWFIPGGKIDPNETNEEALIREVKEELSVDILPETIQYVTTTEGKAHGKAKGTMVTITFFAAQYTGSVQPQAEIETVAYFSYEEAPALTETGKSMLHQLKLSGRL